MHANLGWRSASLEEASPGGGREVCNMGEKGVGGEREGSYCLVHAK